MSSRDRQGQGHDGGGSSGSRSWEAGHDFFDRDHGLLEGPRSDGAYADRDYGSMRTAGPDREDHGFGSSRGGMDRSEGGGDRGYGGDRSYGGSGQQYGDGGYGGDRGYYGGSERGSQMERGYGEDRGYGGSNRGGSNGGEGRSYGMGERGWTAGDRFGAGQRSSGGQSYGEQGSGSRSYGGASYGGPSYGGPSYGGPSYGGPSRGDGQQRDGMNRGFGSGSRSSEGGRMSQGGWDAQESGESRQQGKGPKGYTRSDERLREDVSDRLETSGHDWSDVEVKVENGEVTLTGTVAERSMRFDAEHQAAAVRGVKDVHNQIRVKNEGASSRDGAAGSPFSKSESKGGDGARARTTT